MIHEVCHICKNREAQTKSTNPLDTDFVCDCPTCGVYAASDEVLNEIDEATPDKNTSAAVLSYCVRRMQRAGAVPRITKVLLQEFLKRSLPTAAEQADNLIMLAGERSSPGEVVKLPLDENFSIVGAYFNGGLGYLIRNLKHASLLNETSGVDSVCLSLEGWHKYEELKRGRTHSKKAFMAMEFGNDRLDKVYKAFKASTAATGFNLTRMDELPEAGLIDNRLRVEIQTSRFLVVDLTNDNRGAYWEAGFAEGLTKRVFYTCDKSFFAEKKTHFDANHSYTVLWEVEKLNKAAEELKLAIRATLPDEAKMTDD
jgi:hypothetical protein